MEKIRTLIVEKGKDLSFELEDYKEIEILEFSSNTQKAVNDICTIHPDLLFLEVEMTPFTGFQLLEKIPYDPRDPNPIVIFVASHAEFALEAFRYSPADFILKPINKVKIKKALEKTFRHLSFATQENGEQKMILEYIGSFGDCISTIITTNEILYIDNDKLDAHHVDFHMINGTTYKSRSKESLVKVFRKLRNAAFVRANSHTLVNIRFIQEMIQNRAVKLKGVREIIEVSRRNRDQLKEKIRKWQKEA